MKVGDRVRRNNVLDFEGSHGNIVEVTENYFVVKWDKNQGLWKYTEAQASNINLVSCPSEGQ